MSKEIVGRGISHLGALPLPMPVSLAHVQNLFDDEGNILDPPAEKLPRSLARTVLDYLNAPSVRR